MQKNEIEEIIRLINEGFNLELMAFELEIPIEILQEYKKRLELRQFASKSIKDGQIPEAIEKLEEFIGENEYSIIEKAILLKLRAYSDKRRLDSTEWQEIEEERKKIGLEESTERILEELKVNIPKIKNKKKARAMQEDEVTEEIVEAEEKENYDEVIERYKREIDSGSEGRILKRNLLAYAYYLSGRTEDAENELLGVIEETNNYSSYRLLTYIKKSEGNLEEAEEWGNEALRNFPDSIDIRKQLISIAREKSDNVTVIRLLRDIIKIRPQDEKSNRELQKIQAER